MVRHGKLSKGCQTCRKRKIKCDQSSPSCSQCRKAGWVCPQYGDSVGRMFQYHDPSRFSTDQRGLSQDIDHAATSLQRMNGHSTPHNADHYSIPGYTVPNEIKQSLNDRAINYFLITNAFRDDAGLRGFYEYLPTYNMRTDKEVLTSLTAAALAAYGNRLRDRDLLKRARVYYGRSLRLVNRALESPMNAVRNSTMVSILLLNTFEGLTSEGPRSMAYSDGHVRGVMMVMKLRGQSLMDTRQGQQIFLHMCRCLITYCTIRPARVPADVIILRKHACKHLDTKDPAWMLDEMMIKLANLRAGVHDGEFPNHRSIIDLAVELDGELSLLSNDMHVAWGFGKCKPPESGSHLPTYHHFYPDLWVAYIWNYIHTCRLLLQGEIRDQLAQLSATSPSLSMEIHGRWVQSRQIMQRLISDICASVPQYRDRLSTTEIEQHGDGLGISKGGSNPVPTVAGVYFLLWPLLVAGEMTECSTERIWIINQCRLLGETTGIQRMITVADRLHHGGEALL
ncbi:hypothetical protein BJX76DRAFT_351539 [Aspergillus varians]